MIEPSPQFNPVIHEAHQQLQNDLQAAGRFVAATREFGGATMNPRTGHVFGAGEDVHLVGGHPDPQTGQKIPTRYYDQGVGNPHLSVAQTHAERIRTLILTGSQKDSALGSWVDSKNPRKGVQVDNSTIFRDRRGAEDATLARNEDAMFYMKDLSEPRNEEIRAARGLGPRPSKTD